MESLASVYGPRVSRRRLLQGAVVVAVVGVASWTYAARVALVAGEQLSVATFALLLYLCSLVVLLRYVGMNVR